jgi:hypothetical protein
MIINSQIGRSAVSLSGLASVPEGDAKLITDSECMDTIDTDVNFLKYTSRQQHGLAVCSGRRRGRPRGRTSRGCRHSSYAHQVLQGEGELEQRSEDDSIVKVGSFCFNDDNE